MWRLYLLGWIQFRIRIDTLCAQGFGGNAYLFSKLKVIPPNSWVSDTRDLPTVLLVMNCEFEHIHCVELVYADADKGAICQIFMEYSTSTPIV